MLSCRIFRRNHKLVLDTNITEFVLWHKEGIGVYTTDEYFEYK